MTARYKAVIYDCDGVILDSIESNYLFYNRIMERLGRPEIDRSCAVSERVLHTYSYLDVIEHFFGNDPQKEEALAIGKTIRYRELMPHMKREEELVETLTALKGRVELAICTNRAASMEMIIEDFGLTGFFGCVMTAGHVQNPKPHPEPLLKVLEHYAIAPREALFVGDSDVDRRAAEAAGIPFIAYKSDLPALARIQRHSQLLPHVFG
ncbi:HAD family hydrolase [Trichlorobacter ammonificans]|uniref:phosphoglycolate phosphatase n=1 Tax=Trichlorobacter ammonificans TaxID=2916410 RepID=A0ABM9D9Q3_9BACT|nr:HAD family hydrolase [Trichlorobacter ammonificans]CAH2031883.1 HAD-superfamily hydrolase, subfamily IA, variant 3 [Trichlorobacter ammonificans]